VATAHRAPLPRCTVAHRPSTRPSAVTHLSPCAVCVWIAPARLHCSPLRTHFTAARREARRLLCRPAPSPAPAAHLVAVAASSAALHGDRYSDHLQLINGQRAPVRCAVTARARPAKRALQLNGTPRTTRQFTPVRAAENATPLPTTHAARIPCFSWMSSRMVSRSA